MLIFDEKKYAKNIVDNKRYETIKTQGRERCILVRYLTSLGYSVDDIKKMLSEIPMAGGEYLSAKDKDVIFSKIIAKANEYEFVTDKTIKIYKSELEEIAKVEDEHARHLLFIYLVYYKWASTISYLQFYSKKNDITMVIENNNDIWKLAGLSKLRVADRYRLCNLLFNKGLYRVDNFKSHNYIYIPFSVDEGDVALEISNFDNLLGELLMIESPTEYKRCVVCGKVIRKTRSPKKYCSDCAYQENLRKTKERKARLKTQSL
nr:MAG TPA: hypothetical protein [Caudoviricetes sp.]